MNVNGDKKILRLQIETYFNEQMEKEKPKDGVETADLYELPGLDLERYMAIGIDGMADQEFLLRHKGIVRDYLDEGNIVVFSGHLYRPWLPGANPFIPREIRSFKDYQVSNRNPPHPIFDGVRDEDMTFSKGVAGFFARGHHPLPEGAETLLELPDGEPIAYIDRSSSRGTILVHSGNNLFSYGSVELTTGRIGGQLIEWLRQEHKQLRERRVEA